MCLKLKIFYYCIHSHVACGHSDSVDLSEAVGDHNAIRPRAHTHTTPKGVEETFRKWIENPQGTRTNPLHLKYVMEDALQRRKNIRIMADNTSDNRLQITKLPVNETLIWTQIGNMHFRIYIHVCKCNRNYYYPQYSGRTIDGAVASSSSSTLGSMFGWVCVCAALESSVVGNCM